MVAMLIIFVAVSAVLTIIPGPDLMFILRTSTHGRGPAVAAALGAAAAALAWGAAAAFGVAALLRSSADAFEIVKLAGAAYLIFLGLRTLWQSRKTHKVMTAARPAAATDAGRSGAAAAGRAGTADGRLEQTVGRAGTAAGQAATVTPERPAAAEGAVAPTVSARKAFAQAAGIDLLNPKTGLFYVAVLPQVIPHDVPVLRSTLLFAGVDSLVAASLFTGVACAAAVLIGWLRRPGSVRGLERTTGLSMVVIGIRTAIERT
jgi:threonine/homoserine/homoserine lactone efflux protein